MVNVSSSSSAPRKVRGCRTISAIVFVASMLVGERRFFAVFAFATSLRAREYSRASLEGSKRGKENEGDGGKTRFCYLDPVRCVV